MEADIFSVVAGKIREAGSDNPVEVARRFDIMVVDLKGSIVGYAALYHGLVPAIGINVSLSGKWYMLTGWHELVHVFDRHIYESGFRNGHADFSCFGREVDDHAISRQERIANLVAADVCVPDGDVLDVIGYDNPALQSYRRLKAHQDRLVHEFETLRFLTDSPPARLKSQMTVLRKKIREVNSAISEMESGLISMNCCRTFSGMAKELEISEAILRYKLEAMRMKGLDIDRQELERYDRLFVDVI